jgi:hypothetical protein
MWPGRGYWVWSLGLVAVLALGVVLVLLIGGPSGGGLGNDLLGLCFGIVFWLLLSGALWLVLRVGRVEARNAAEWLWVALWIVLGLTIAVATLALGAISLLPATAVVAWLAYRRGFRRSVYGLMSGLGALLILFDAWQDTHTTDVCTRVGPNTVECSNRIGFVYGAALGLLLLISGVVAQSRRPAGRREHTV